MKQKGQNMKAPILFLFTIYILCNISATQIPKHHTDQHRIRGQKYIEDSAHVYWDNYPNPFSPPTVRDTGKGLMCGELGFYCDLSDSVEVTFLQSNDSIVYQTMVIQSRPSFALCYWMAGPKIDHRSLPTRYFRAPSNEQIKIFLSVGGRKKNLRKAGFQVQKGWYYWIHNRVSNKP